MKRSVEDMVKSYQKIAELKKKAYLKQKATDPFFKQMGSIRTMKNQAKRAGNLKRVKELEERYEVLKEQRDEYKKNNPQ